MFDLKKFRKDNNLSQKDAALYFGCKQPFISQIERGEGTIPKNYISKIKVDGIYKYIFEDDEIEKPLNLDNMTNNETVILRLANALEELSHTLKENFELKKRLSKYEPDVLNDKKGEGKAG